MRYSGDQGITSHFLNAVLLFNGAVPLGTNQVQAHKIGGNISLVFTKVLEEMQSDLSGDHTSAILDDASIKTVEYSTRWSRYRSRVTEKDFKKHTELFKQLFGEARDRGGWADAARLQKLAVPCERGAVVQGDRSMEQTDEQNGPTATRNEATGP